MATGTLLQIAGDIQARLETVLTTMRYTPPYPTEQIPAFPALIVYVAGGTWNLATFDDKRSLARLVIEIHERRQSGALERAYPALMPFLDSVPNAMFAGRRGNLFNYEFTFDTITFTMGPGKWNDVDTVMLQFVVEDLKVRNTF